MKSTLPILNNPELIAYCGLYCGSCKAYLKGSCPGCKKNEKATWCKVRTCCIENNYQSCAGCNEFTDIMECKKFNNFFSKFFALIFRSDRPACIAMIRESGYETFATYMSENRLQSIKRK